MLVDEARAGGREAFERLYVHYRDRCYRLVYGLTGNAWDAQDVVQEAFVNAYKALPSFRGNSAFGSWLYRIALNQARSALRQRGRRRRSEVLVDDIEISGKAHGDEQGVGPDASLATKDRIAEVQAAIRALPELYREAIVLRDLDGRDYGEIAVILGCSIGTVKSRIHRGRLLLAERLKGGTT